MTFNSLSYFVFLPIVYLVFYFTKDRYRRLVMLIASYIFYATFKAPQLLIVLVFVTGVSFFYGVRLSRTTVESERRILFWMGSSFCLLVLVISKYLPPFLTSYRTDISFGNLLISIGVSYFTFQAISYLSDVYLELLEPEQHLRYHALALAFFPKLLQGPIERGGDILPQLKQPYVFDYDNMRSALLLFTWGLFKKIVVADRLALFVDQVYGDVHSYSGIPLLIATYAYALQIFFDFSGYTDMARGAARMFGINLTENFNSPYLATSIADFWRRWHISFSRWILDYIFKPLQMAWRDHKQTGTALALIVTFFVSGIWHGASWGFVVWGLIHGIYLASSTYYRPYQKKLHRFLGVEKNKYLKLWQVFLTFNMVCLTWIFFRAGSLSDGWYVLSHLWVSSGQSESSEYILRNIFLGQSSREFFVIITLLIFTGIISFVVQRTGKRNLVDFLESRSLPFRWAVYYVLIFSTMIFAVYGNGAFIYYKF